MTRRPAKTYDCWWCGHTCGSVTEHAIHAATCTAPRSAISRPVHCPACATPIDLRTETTCATCDRPYNTKGNP